MNHTESHFKGGLDTELYYQSWLPDGDIRAVLLIVHGMGEHSGRYFNVVNHLVPKGFAIYAHDHRGHGRSGGQQGFVSSWSEYYDDLGTFVQLVAAKQPNIPFFMLGHSMGGNILLNYLLHHPTTHHPDGVRAVISSAPAVGVLDVPPVLAFISRLLSGIWPTLSVPTGLDGTAISRDAKAVELYLNDSLVHDKGTPRFATEISSSAAWAMDNARSFQPPVLMIHGSADKLVNAQASRDFFAKIPHDNKKLIIYEDGAHESHNDIEYERVLADMESWLNSYL